MANLLKKIFTLAKKAVPQFLRRFIGYTVWGTIKPMLKRSYSEFKRTMVTDGGYAVRYYRRKGYRNTIGMHACFLPKENILFLKEWVLYHKLKGVDYFFLYDNTGVGTYEGHDFLRFDDGAFAFTPSRSNKYGVRYDALVKLSRAEILAVLDDIQKTVPGVYIRRWQPRDEHGVITHAQLDARKDARERFGHLCDWMFITDPDEFLVCEDSLKDVTRRLFLKGYVGGVFGEKRVTGRYQNLDKYCVEVDVEHDETVYANHRNYKQYFHRTNQTGLLEMHYFETNDAVYHFPLDELVRYHYHDNKYYRNRIRKLTPLYIDPQLIAQVKEQSGDYCSPKWRANSVISTTEVWAFDPKLIEHPIG